MLVHRSSFTSESVSAGHPDKLCDQISDAILDAYLEKDSKARIACEVLAKDNKVVIAGECKSRVELDEGDIEGITREVIRQVGYAGEWGKTGTRTGAEGEPLDADTCAIYNWLGAQSADIAQGVDGGNDQGAGDQGLMFGYACDETDELMPAPILYAHKLVQTHGELRKSDAGIGERLGPDAKSQITLHYTADGELESIGGVVFSTHHREDMTENQVRDLVLKRIVRPVLPEVLVEKMDWDDSKKVHINPAGPFVVGGTQGDCGLTGRKIIVDTYGGYARHGGGAFSGKDPSKVDRSAAYACRYIAKNLVAAGLARQCEIQVAYAIGYPEPVSLSIDTAGSEVMPVWELEALVRKVFDMRPQAIIERLQLERPIYASTAAYGHFGRKPENGMFPWEALDMVDELKRASG